MHRTLLFELLSQMINSLQAADLGQKPLLVALLYLLQTLPGIGNILKRRERKQASIQSDKCLRTVNLSSMLTFVHY